MAFGLGVGEAVAEAMGGDARRQGYGEAVDPTARFAELVQGPEEAIPLDQTALLIAAHAYPDLDVAGEIAVLDDLAAGCPASTLDAWRRYVFVDLGFSGNVGSYYDPANSYLNDVVRRRMGLPITLSVVGMELGRRVGLHFQGVGMPGHFLLRDDGDPPTFVDPFDAGRLLDRAGCEERFHAVNGAEAPFLPSYLEPVGSRTILSRMLANLRSIFVHTGNLKGLEWVLTLRLSIPGVSPLERRDLARVLGSAGRFDEAAAHLESLAETVPEQSHVLLGDALAFRARLN
jgi:regulator of sirC expression with transglutaminase-like and TPR domain